MGQWSPPRGQRLTSWGLWELGPLYSRMMGGGGKALEVFFSRGIQILQEPRNAFIFLQSPQPSSSAWWPPLHSHRVVFWGLRGWEGSLTLLPGIYLKHAQQHTDRYTWERFCGGNLQPGTEICPQQYALTCNQTFSLTKRLVSKTTRAGRWARNLMYLPPGHGAPTAFLSLSRKRLEQP